jgi:hypothetical protein
MRVLAAQAYIGTGSLAAINDGRPVNARVLGKIAGALATHQELPGVDQLFADLSDRRQLRARPRFCHTAIAET